MSGIFISYRREDAAGHAGRLFDRLSEHFGRDRVFMDVSGIEPGVDFVEAIETAVGA
ncbi:MAG: TIR domain-containing protein, partial [Burkholderiales bacterium]